MMTCEEALEGLIKERDLEKSNRDIWDEEEDRIKSDRYVEMLSIAIKALEQQDILDKMRTEIDLETRIEVKHYTNTDAVIDAVLDVIDKYKAQSEE